MHVAVGVIVNRQGQVLISKRDVDAHQGGLWEFPGGKLEQGENLGQSLKRELMEELGIFVDSFSPLIKINHAYSDRKVLLEVAKIDHFRGEPTGLEGQPIRWVSPDSLTQCSLLEADRPIVTAIRIPPFYPILQATPGGLKEIMKTLGQMIDNGMKLIRLRAGDSESYPKIAQCVCDTVSGTDVSILLDSNPELVYETKAGGMHLNSRRLMEAKARPLDADYWVSASCHNERQLKQAENLGVDFVVLSPVSRTQSHPNAVPMGWDVFETLVEPANLPVYALGGLGPSDLETARSRGAQGISGIRAFLKE